MQFRYKAKNKQGEVREGTLEANDKIALARVLRAEGFYILDVRALQKGGGSAIQKIIQMDLSRFTEMVRGVPLDQKMLFSRNMAVMISSGIPLMRALNVLIKQTRSQMLRSALEKIQRDIEKGTRFSDALARHPKVFSTLYSSLVRAGEETGKLDETLDLLAEQLEKEHELKSRIRGALIYPVVILTALGGVGVLMMLFVVPQLKSVFEDLGVELPLATRSILLMSDLLRFYWWAFLVGFPVVLFGLKMYMGTKIGRRMLAWILLHIPLFKSIVRKINNASFARTLSSLLSGGVPILSALDITSTTVTNVYYQEAIVNAKRRVKKGEKLYTALEQYPDLYTPLVVEMVEVGEETGKLPELLKRIAEFYEGEVADITKNLSSIIEPLLMMAMGGLVGFFAIAIMQPIYGILGNI